MERLEKLVDAIKDEKPADAEEIFKSEMSDRIKDALAQRKLEIGKHLFSKTPKEKTQLYKLMDPEE